MFTVYCSCNRRKTYYVLHRISNPIDFCSIPQSITARFCARLYRFPDRDDIIIYQWPVKIDLFSCPARTAVLRLFARGKLCRRKGRTPHIINELLKILFLCVIHWTRGQNVYLL